MRMPRKSRALPPSPFHRFNSEVIRLVVLMYVRIPLSMRIVEDLLHERGIDLRHETVRFWWNQPIGSIPSAEAEATTMPDSRNSIWRHDSS